MKLSYEDFDDKHVVYNKELEEFQMWDINVINVRAGKEAERVAAVFGVSPNSIIHASGPEDEYVSFMANKLGDTRVVASGEHAMNPDNSYYYPDFEPYMVELFLDYHEMQKRLPEYMTNKQMVENLYKTLGMETTHD